MIPVARLAIINLLSLTISLSALIHRNGYRIAPALFIAARGIMLPLFINPRDCSLWISMWLSGMVAASIPALVLGEGQAPKWLHLVNIALAMLPGASAPLLLELHHFLGMAPCVAYAGVSIALLSMYVASWRRRPWIWPAIVAWVTSFVSSAHELVVVFGTNTYLHWPDTYLLYTKDTLWIFTLPALRAAKVIATSRKRIAAAIAVLVADNAWLFAWPDTHPCVATEAIQRLLALAAAILLLSPQRTFSSGRNFATGAAK